MIAGTPTGTVAGDRTLPPVARELCWLPGSRLSNGEAMPDRAALIQAQIPGLRRFACALLRGDREVADDLVQDTLERALTRWNLRRNQGNLRGWLYTILYNRFLSNQHRLRRRGPHDALMEDTELRGIEGGSIQCWSIGIWCAPLRHCRRSNGWCCCWSASKTSPTRRRRVGIVNLTDPGRLFAAPLG